MITAEDKIIRAKIQLQKEKPFFAFILMKMNIINKEDLPIKSMGVDNKGNLYYVKEFIDKLTESELKGILCHEVLHIVLQHLERAKINNKDTKLYNIATDIVVNDILVSNDFDLFKNGLIPSFNHSIRLEDEITIKDIDEKTAENVYYELLKICPKIKEEIIDNHFFGKEVEQKDIEELKKKWKQILAQAVEFSKMKGNLPVGIKKITDDILTEKMSWKQMLYKYITNEVITDYTYSSPSKRALATGLYLPKAKKENIKLVVSVDTSGSIGKAELNEFLTEIKSIVKSFESIELFVIICDYEVNGVYKIDSHSNSNEFDKIEFKGGGGTSHIPVFDYIKENLENVKLLISLTDGYTEFPKEESIKTLWAISKYGVKNENHFPFGEVIFLN